MSENIKKTVMVQRELFKVESLEDWQETIEEELSCSCYNNNVDEYDIIMIDQNGTIFPFNCELELCKNVSYPIEAFLI